MSDRVTGSAGGGAGRRLRRFEERFEPVVTSVLLLGIFVTGLLAQFVKPVGDALEGKTYLGGALLSLVGYVLYDQVKELNSSIRTPHHSLVGSTRLDGFVSEAFRSRTVQIRFLGYTGETLHHALLRHLGELQDNPGPTRSVTIRILVPDFGQPMIVPSKVGADADPEDDPDFRERIKERCCEYDDILSRLARQITDAGRVSVSCEYRLYPGIPRDKICIFNQAVVLHGLYDLSWRMEHNGVVYFDPKGFETDLNMLTRAGGAAAEAAVSLWSKQFDDLWSLAKRPDWRQNSAA
jgi:hypothetical protein